MLTIWPLQHCSDPQVRQQPAIAAASLQVELVGIGGRPDPLCLLHSDTNTKNKITSLESPEQS